MAETISRSIFKAYDIRGIVDKTLTEEVCEKVGMALGTLAQKKNVSHICVGRDGRLSGPRLQAALMKGIRRPESAFMTSVRFRPRCSISVRSTLKQEAALPSPEATILLTTTV